MRVLKAFAISVMVIFGLNVTGCCGTSSTTTKETEKVVVPAGSQATLGDELKDLKEAYDKGAMTQKEYEDAREKIMKERGVK